MTEELRAAERSEGMGTSRSEAAGTDPGIDVRVRDRLRTVVCCLALTCLATSTRPGAILADTKIDMSVNPLAFLGRALHLWDGEQFGQLQNQAAGYLFPMGPFHVVGHLVGMPAWITQRLWLALLLCLAFLGTRRLAARLDVGGPAARLVAGMVYALAPSGLASLGQISSDYLPYAMAPWIVLPLITAARSLPDRGRRGRLIIRAAARSGIAVACCGGINATATAAVLVVPVVYILTRPRGAPRLRMLTCWSAAVSLATFWWLVPLLLTARYGFSWLTYTEKAATTTGPTGLVNVFRGAERWVGYLVIDGQVWWPVGHSLSLAALPVLCTGLVAALGLGGLVRTGLPERAFLLLVLLTGIVVISAGHISAIEGPLAAPLRDLLDGPLAPLRNLHRFDALIRLPIALGAAHLISSVPAAQARLRTLAVTFVALGGIAATALTSGLSGPGDFREVPRHWRDAAAWLNSRAGGQGVLAVPGTPFGDYVWGRPMDDIMQPLLSARWGVRQLVPAGSAGYTRALDAIDQVVTTGRRSPGLSQFLARMGVRYVLVRNDLRREGLRGGWPARVHQALDQARGLRRVAAFGAAPIGWPAVDDAVGGFDQRYPPLEVYEVAATSTGTSTSTGPGAGTAPVRLADASRAIRLYGSPEALLTMADNGVLRDRPVLLNDDSPGSGGTPVVSDSLRLVKRNFGELHENSPTLTSGERHQAADVVERGWNRYATVAAFSGVKAVTASNSTADADAIPQLHDAGRLPYAAMDGNPWSYWETGGWTGPIGQWLKVEFDRPTAPAKVSATFVRDTDVLGPPPSRIAVDTEAGTVVQSVRSSSSPQVLRVAPGQTRWLRIRILRLARPVAAPLLARVGISELAVEGVRAGRHYQLPAPPSGALRPSSAASPVSGVSSSASSPGGSLVPSLVMARSPGAAPGCMKGSVRWVCASALERQDEELGGFDRTFPSPAPATAAVSGTATLVDSPLVRRFTALGARIRVAASSSRSSDPAVLARSAFDGDPATTWIAGDDDIAPKLAVSWGRRRIRVDRISISRPPGARGPLRVRVRADNGDTREGLLDSRGRLAFAPLMARRLTLTFTVSGQLSVQITDVTVPGVRRFPRLGRFPLKLGCGLGPRLEFNGVMIPSRVTGTMADLLEGRPLRFTACRHARIVAGQNRLRPAPFGPYRIESAVVDTGRTLGRPAGEVPEQEVQVRRWSQEAREVTVQADRRSFLVVNENFNTGWRATAGKTVLRPVRLDGWKQAWVVPAGTTETIKLTYGPDRIHRIAVLSGLCMLIVLAMVGCLRCPSRTAPRPAPRRWRGVRWTVLPLAAGLGFWVAGLPGLAVTLTAAVVFAWARTGRSRAARAVASSWLVAAVMFAGSASWALGARLYTADNPAAPTDGLRDLTPQLLGLVIVGRLVIGLWRTEGIGHLDDPARHRNHRWRPPDTGPGG